MFGLFGEAKTNELKNGLKGIVDTVKAQVSSLASGKFSASDVGICYVTENLLAMPFPESSGSLLGSPIHNLAAFLLATHSDKFMVWNLSDRKYDTSVFKDQVIEFSFPGYPAPPLDRIFAICKSIDGWLRCDEQNIAAIHCQTGKGRTIATIAAYLAWSGAFPSAMKAALKTVTAKKGTVEDLLIPTQIRYVRYFDKLLSGAFPSANILILKRVIVNSIPNFNVNGVSPGCRPYLQVFKYGKLIFSSNSSSAKVKSYCTDDGSMNFQVNLALEGDILIRLRHIDTTLGRCTMFRIGFHTGYITEGIERFNRSDVDGACKPNFSSDFIVDCCFENALDSEGSLMYSQLDQTYWKTVCHREVPKHTDIRSSLSDGGACNDIEDKSFADLEKYVNDFDEDDNSLSDSAVSLGEDDDFFAQLQKELDGSTDDKSDQE